MEKSELTKFLEKVKELNLLVESLESNPLRREKLESCKTHEEVVALAKTWGFKIGRRWGE